MATAEGPPDLATYDLKCDRCKRQFRRYSSHPRCPGCGAGPARLSRCRPAPPIFASVAVIAVAGQPTANGNVYTEAALRAAADGKTRFYEDGKLVHRGPIPGA